MRIEQMAPTVRVILDRLRTDIPHVGETLTELSDRWEESLPDKLSAYERILDMGSKSYADIKCKLQDVPYKNKIDNETKSSATGTQPGPVRLFESSSTPHGAGPGAEPEVSTSNTGGRNTSAFSKEKRVLRGGTSQDQNATPRPPWPDKGGNGRWVDSTRQLKCNTGDGIAGTGGRHGPDPPGDPAVDPTVTPHPPEPDGGSTWVRHDRGGVDVDSLMQTSEDASAVSCELDHFTTSTVQGAESVDVTSDVLAGRAERQLKCNTGDGIAGTGGRHGPDPLGEPAVDPTVIPRPPEPDGGSSWVRHDRGGVDVDSLMQTSEDTLLDACDLGLLFTFLTQGTVSIEWSKDTLAGMGLRHRVDVKANTSSATFSRLRDRVGDAPPWILRGGPCSPRAVPSAPEPLHGV